jgi:hypothetical protein
VQPYPFFYLIVSPLSLDFSAEEFGTASFIAELEKTGFINWLRVLDSRRITAKPGRTKMLCVSYLEISSC